MMNVYKRFDQYMPMADARIGMLVFEDSIVTNKVERFMKFTFDVELNLLQIDDGAIRPARSNYSHTDKGSKQYANALTAWYDKLEKDLKISGMDLLEVQWGAHCYTLEILTIEVPVFPYWIGKRKITYVPYPDDVWFELDQMRNSLEVMFGHHYINILKTLVASAVVSPIDEDEEE